MSPCFPSQIKRFPFTGDEVADLWKHAKERYIDKGATFEETIRGMARDTGMRTEHIAQAFTMPKVTRLISNDVFTKMQRRRDAITNARAVIENLDDSRFSKIIDAAYNAPRSALLAGHGAVFPMTHMGQMLFQPGRWGVFFRASARAWRYIGERGSKRYEIAMQRQLADPDYAWARRGSKSVDPTQETVGLLRNMKSWNARGFNTLKIARLELFKQRWKNLDPGERTAENARAIMNVVDSATGEVNLGQSGKLLAKLFLAPKLMPARFKQVLVDPYRAAKTFANWKNASAGERQAARFVMSGTAQNVAFYAAALAANQGLNMVFGGGEGDDKVNLTNPNKSDWLTFKFGGLTVRPPNAFVEVLRLVGGMTAAYMMTPEKKLKGATPEHLAGERLLDYGRYKLHPAIRLGGEFASGKDLFGRPLPFSGVRQYVTGEPAKASKTKPAIGYPEYLLGKGPIPFGGGAREFYDMLRQEGMGNDDAKAWLKAAAVAVTESAGISAHETHAGPPAN